MAVNSHDDWPEDLTIFIILDAFRHDYLEKTTYLKTIAEWKGQVCEPFGFISTRPAMCAGRHPEETNFCFEYVFRPDESIFQPWLFRLLAAASGIVPTRFLRLAGSAWIRLTHSAPVIRETAFIGNMPFDRFPLFDITERDRQTDENYLSWPTLYNLLRAEKERILYYGFARPKNMAETIRRIYSRMIANDLFEADKTMIGHFTKQLPAICPGFAHLHFSACDWVGHKYGPESKEMALAIAAVDNQVKTVHQLALRYYKNVQLLVSADHGMVPVHHYHDIEEVLSSLPFKQPEDFIVFKDSTIARFWFFNPDAQETIFKVLQTLEWGRILSETDMAAYHIRFSDNTNGDLFFLLDPGHVLFPNYYQAKGFPPRGMHGYDPSCQDNIGAVLLTNPPKSISLEQGSLIQMVDIFPTLLDMYGLGYPDNLSGTSVMA